jgi:hypothetical protein
VGKIKKFASVHRKSTVENDFISSTSVYGDENDQVTEETTLNPDSEGGRQLEIVETLYKIIPFQNDGFTFGGLIGEDRNPARFLAGKENLDNPNAPINLIHQKTVLELSLKLLSKQAWETTFNAATPYHPSRETYYTQKQSILD